METTTLGPNNSENYRSNKWQTKTDGLIIIMSTSRAEHEQFKTGVRSGMLMTFRHTTYGEP
jgi:hypothetical protein